MTYDIYFHDDFDGRSSAAVMLNFLESRGDSIKNFYPVDFNISWQKRKIAASNRRNPAIVVDFPYHPEAAAWFDHHETTFLKKGWQRKFRPSRLFHWDPKAPSCCGLIVKSLEKDFDYQPPKHIKELARWLDMIDSAHFRSAKQVIEKKEPALQLEEFIDSRKTKDELGEWFIRILANLPLEKIVKDNRIRKFLPELKTQRKKSFAFYRRNLKLIGRITFIDLSRTEIRELRVASFYIYPKVVYGLAAKRYNNGLFSLSLSANPWRRWENRVHLGEFLRKNFGGGGHHDAAGATFKFRKLVQAAVQKIINNLR